MYMWKRGQVTVFVIIGVVILILAALLLYLKSTDRLEVPTIFLGFSGKRQAIDDNLKDCVNKAVRPTIQLAALQGGEINPKYYRLYNGSHVGYLCWNIPGDKQCYNIMPTLNTLQNRMKGVIAEKINNCVDRSLLDGLEIKGSRNVDVDFKILRDSVFVNIDYDVVLVDNGVEFPVGSRKLIVEDLPFGELYDVARDIVNSEATIGDFEQLFYMLAVKGRYEIQVDRPFPDKIFIINKKDSDFKFQLAIQGESTVA